MSSHYVCDVCGKDAGYEVFKVRWDNRGDTHQDNDLESRPIVTGYATSDFVDFCDSCYKIVRTAFDVAVVSLKERIDRADQNKDTNRATPEKSAGHTA